MIYKRGKVYWYKFVFNGVLYRESTKQGNDKVARSMESAHRTSLAKGEVGIREKKPAPTLAAFLSERLLPWAEATFAAERNNLKWYRNEARVLQSYKPLARLALDNITSETVSDFAAWRTKRGRAVSTVNSTIRVLRSALNLAVAWRVLNAVPKIEALGGERRRDHVVTPEEEALYLEKASPLLREVVTILFDAGLRPDECFRMRWENVKFINNTGALLVRRGKSINAPRAIPMTPRVRDILEARWLRAGKPIDGWVWPAKRAKAGHIVPNTIYEPHLKAVKESGVRRFVLYSLRHTFLTRLGESGCDAWTLARIAGHGSINVSARYVHPSDERTLAAIARLVGEKTPEGGHKSGHSREFAVSEPQPKLLVTSSR